MITAFIQKVAYLKENKLPFALFCLPEGTVIQLYYQDDMVLHKSNSLDFEGFVMAPFDWNKMYNFVPSTKQLTITKTAFLKEYAATDKSDFSNENLTKNTAHIALVNKAIQFIKNQEATKIVCSRKETVKGTLAYLKTYAMMLKNYPFAFNYSFYHPEIGHWQGASPERLLVFKNTSLETVSLAGTQAFVSENTLSYVWKEKEQLEQQIVTDYIVEKLKTITDEVSATKAQTVLAGNVVHLKSIIQAKLDKQKLQQAIDLLHPTPAVCGFPTEIAKQFIIENEGYDRSYYTGFFGLVTADIVMFNVNLRCMKITKDVLHFFIGGGINQGSNAEAEWEETCLKSGVMKQIVILE